jgi:serine/threonine protein kinase/sugar lactone lactonase YvrE
MSEPILPEAQQQIGPFKLLEELGKGGFATVYRAEDTRLHRHVALKLLHAHLASNTTLVRRFMGEARAASRTRHPNIVTIYDVGETDDHRPYLVMEFLEGTVLSALIETHRDLQAQAPAFLLQLAAAADYLHRYGIVHRDLKPSNVMVSEGDQLTVMDFGIARSLADEDHLTQTGQFVGTPIYIAPEQVTGQEVGPAADIYALGVLAYELYSGRPPFLGDTVRVLHAHVYEPPPPLEELRPGLPQGIYSAIAAALAKNPAERPSTATEFAMLIASAATTMAAPTRAPASERQAQSAQNEPKPMAQATPSQPSPVRPAAPSEPELTVIVPPYRTPTPPELLRPQAIPASAEPKRRIPVALIGGLAVVLLAAAIAVVLLMRGSSAPAPIAQGRQTAGVSGSGSLAGTQAASAAPSNQAVASPASGSPALPAVSAAATAAGAQPTTGSAVVASAPAPTAQPPTPAPAVISTLAGSGTAGFADGAGGSAQFSTPTGVAVDKTGNVYVADNANNRIRKIAPDGSVTTLAGSGDKGLVDGRGTAAQFNAPTGLAIDSAGTLYVADTFNHRIRKIAPDGTVTTLAGSGEQGLGGGGFADGPPGAAKFREPTGIAVDAAGNLYVADKGNNRIRKITPAGDVSTLAGSGAPDAAGGGFADGPSASARFNAPGAVAVDAAGNVYVADTFNQRIRTISPAGYVTTLAGSSAQGAADGMGTAASFRNPGGIAVDAAGNVYVADTSNQRIRVIAPSGAVTTFAGSGKEGFADGPAPAAQFDFPQGLVLDAASNLYVADSVNQRIRKLAAPSAGH